jgi:hypothetical protein
MRELQVRGRRGGPAEQATQRGDSFTYITLWSFAVNPGYSRSGLFRDHRCSSYKTSCPRDLSTRSNRYNPYLIVSFIALTAPAVCRAEQWLQWRGPDRVNRATETGLFSTWQQDGPPLLWTASGMGSGYASVSVSNSQIFTTGNLTDGPDERQAVVAVDAGSGSVL